MASNPRNRTTRKGHSARQLRRAPTPAEALLWTLLRNRHAGGFKFRRQQPLGDYVADFFCAESKLVIEVDGDIHDLRADLDAARTQWLEEGGLQVLRFRNERVLGAVGVVVSEIVDVCRRQVREMQQAAADPVGSPTP